MRMIIYVTGNNIFRLFHCNRKLTQRAEESCEQYIKEGKSAIKWTRLSC